MPRPAFVWSPHYEMDIGKHVFPTSKFRLIKEQLVREGVVNPDETELAPPATDDQLLGVLEPEYLRDLMSHRHTPRTISSELPITRQIIEGCRYTAGGTILCAQRALERGGACHLGGGFHHGFADHAEGFCYINDVAIAAMQMLQDAKCNRIAIIDTDVHQGNGTARIFRNDERVFTFSIHQEQLYPPKEKSDLDIGVEMHIGDAGYLALLEAGLSELFSRFDPQLIIYVAGVDPYEGDVLGSLGLSMGGMELRDRMVLEACVAGSIPFVTVTGGGYARRLEDTVALHVNTILAGIDLLEA
jgi:acetoin utilization deacetylase AcuC-like enzyme